MRILLAGPNHPQGSLPPYLTVLADELRRIGAHVDRLGSTGVPYDTEHDRFHNAQQVLNAADSLADQIDPRHYDLISLHFGNLEIEQLLPDRWRRRYARMPPIVVHIHALDWTLFTHHIPSQSLRAAVDDAVNDAAGLVYFGQYAHAAINARLPGTARTPAPVVPLPTTIPIGTIPSP